jgi:acyl carrier protein
MEFSNLIVQVIGIDKSQITIDTSPATEGKWTSLKHLKLIKTVESAYNVRFTINEMKKLSKVGAFLEVLRNKGVQDVFL